jgi:hypothetical protein
MGQTTIGIGGAQLDQCSSWSFLILLSLSMPAVACTIGECLITWVSFGNTAIVCRAQPQRCWCDSTTSIPFVWPFVRWRIGFLPEDVTGNCTVSGLFFAELGRRRKLLPARERSQNGCGTGTMPRGEEGYRAVGRVASTSQTLWSQAPAVLYPQRCTLALRLH